LFLRDHFLVRDERASGLWSRRTSSDPEDLNGMADGTLAVFVLCPKCEDVTDGNISGFFMPAVVVRCEGDRCVTDLCFPSKFGFRKIGLPITSTPQDR
jgi:hypothetical protein